MQRREFLRSAAVAAGVTSLTTQWSHASPMAVFQNERDARKAFVALVTALNDDVLQRVSVALTGRVLQVSEHKEFWRENLGTDGIDEQWNTGYVVSAEEIANQRPVDWARFRAHTDYWGLGQYVYVGGPPTVDTVPNIAHVFAHVTRVGAPGLPRGLAVADLIKCRDTGLIVRATADFNPEREQHVVRWDICCNKRPQAWRRYANGEPAPVQPLAV